MPTEEHQEQLAIANSGSAPSRSGSRRPRPTFGAGGRRVVQCRRAGSSTSRGDSPVDRESEQEAELRALMVMASHDLKSPLASVVMHVDMLRTDYGAVLGEEFARDLAAVDRGLGRMARLTQDLLDYARAGHIVSLAPVCLQEVVDDVAADYRAGSGSPEIVVPEMMPTVLADSGLLRHLLDNLVGNAVKYSRTGCTARVEIGVRSQQDGTVRVEVADQGIGIPAEDRSKVFDAFHRCANSGERPGTGLGLAICKRIAERHGGNIGVDAVEGGGSRFWFTVAAAVPGE
jgi:signal transduction histidine kinase